jgi:PAS domain S-box-containing protein
MGVIFAAHSVYTRLKGSLAELGQRSVQLQKTVAQLKESEEKYRILAENSTDVVFVQDLDLRVKYVSPSAAHLFGYSFEEIMQQSMKDWMTEDSLQRALTEYTTHLEHARKGERVVLPLMQYEYRRKDGSTFWGEIRVTLIYDDDGEIVGSQGVLRDITQRKKSEFERKKLEEELRQSEKMRVIGQLAGGVAHDFNNQLAGMMGFAEMIARDTGAPEKIREYAHNIIIGGKRSADLTCKLLAFARRGTFITEPVNVHELIQEVVAILRHSIDKKIRVEQHFEAQHYVVNGDSTLLQNALLNIGLNGRDAMPEGGELVFSTSNVVFTESECSESPFEIGPGSYCAIAISDNGTGMDSITAQRIFEPFFTTKEQGKGIGMGLSAVYGTVKSHKGAIATETDPNRGTVFTLSLPLAEQIEKSDERTLPDADTITPPLPRGSGTIMLVDDENLVAHAARLALEHAGFTVHTFTSPADSIGFYREHFTDIDLVILDLIMPEIGGGELLRVLHGINPTIHALICSGYNQQQDLQNLESIGMRGFVSKPFTSVEISDSAASIIAKRRRSAG